MQYIETTYILFCGIQCMSGFSSRTKQCYYVLLYYVHSSTVVLLYVIYKCKTYQVVYVAYVKTTITSKLRTRRYIMYICILCTHIAVNIYM